ncbi:HWE histidine kinase domain-containing protein [Ensifer soli]|uniref:HWE histidine kinase domain-containing protein n=1 Tax=Ciceribacter sp. sgz301302 TaxID=3342379 RepID=UPI0035B6DD29
MTDLPYRIDLTNCDQEQIHRLGQIQPFGFLLALSRDWMVARASANIDAFFPVTVEDVLGQHASRLMSEDAIHRLRNRLAILRGPDMVERSFGLALYEGGPLLDIALHISNDMIIVEGEPAQDAAASDSTMSIRTTVARLDQAVSLDAFFRDGARQARALTGFDRVMVYRFDETGSGEVVAEAARGGIGSFLGLHYPASDIPAQARALYVRNLFRIIADVDAEAVPILPLLDAHGAPLDLSMSGLRSVSPIHIEYLRNMGVKASLSISIIVDGRLWGLFACHHYAARLPSLERRTAAELFGQMFSSRLESRERRIAMDYETKARQIADRLLTSVADNASLLTDPTWLIDALGDAIPADGIGVWINGRSALSGIAPSPDGFARLVKALNRNAAGRIFATDQLNAHYPEAAEDGHVAGLLAIPISRSPRDYVVLFRQEIITQVRWAGDPHKPIEYGPNGPRLTPRKSFEAWSELVRDRSHPFTAAERRVAETIRVTLIEVVLRLADEANVQRQQAQERQELLIAELNHRVRNILSLIGGLIRKSRTASASQDDYVAQLEGRVHALARAHDQLTRDHWSPAPFRQLLQAEAAAYLGQDADRLVTEGEDVVLQPQAFSTASLVFHELVTNSAKYGSLGAEGTVLVSWERDDQGTLHVRWRERDGPPVTPPTRQGFGTTLIRRSIPYDLGGTAEMRFAESGLEADFTIPPAFVGDAPPKTRKEGRPGGTERPTQARRPARPLKDMRVLLVEDNLIIAMDGEDILTQLGAAEVQIAASVGEALRLIGETPFDFAVLDVNLGEENSFPIADRLLERGTPVLFATGYGEGIGQPESHAGHAVLQKPYTIESVASALGSHPAITDG